MSKSTHFIGQPSYLQLIKLLNRSKVDHLIRRNGYDRYTKKFDAYTHLITFLYAVLSRYDSTREEGLDEVEIPDNADLGIIKDEVIVLRKGVLEHRCRRIVYWEESKEKLIVFLTNNLRAK